MQAVRIHHPSAPGAAAFSPASPAPASALHHDAGVPVPRPQGPGEFLVRIRATTVTRDELTWPETYGPEFPIMGHDLAGVVESAYPSSPQDAGDDSARVLAPGAEVYGIVNLQVGTTWAELAVGKASELALKPKGLGWAQAASVALSGLTAWQALFDKARVPEPDFSGLTEAGAGAGPEADKILVGRGKTLLVTGASGAVGMYLVQLARLVGFHVVAASRSNPRNSDFLKSLGASEVIEYGDMSNQKPDSFDIIIDTVGRDILGQCWPLVAGDGALITVDSGSFEFDQKPKPAGREGVAALFFIVEPSGRQLSHLSRALELGLIKTFVAETFPLAEARAAYEKANGRLDRRGKVVLTL